MSRPEPAPQPNRRQLKTWLARLRSDDSSERARVAAHLEQNNDPAIIELIVEELESAKGYLPGHTLRTLVRLAMPFGPQAASILPAFFPLFHIHNSHKLRLLAVDFIAACGQAAKDVLLQDLELHSRSPRSKLSLKEELRLLVPLEGDDIDERLRQLATNDALETRLAAVEALGLRKRPCNFDFLLGLANQLPRLGDTFHERERLQHTAAKALAQAGEQAEVLLPTLQEYLKHSYMGYKRLAIELMGLIGTEEAIECIVRYLEPTETPTKKNPNIPGKLQKSAAKALRSLASPALLDRIVPLFLDGKTYEYSWRAVAETIVALVTQEMDPSAGFVWVRTLLQGEPSQRMWYLLCALVNAWPQDDRPMVLDYIDNHINHWDDMLRHVEYTPWDNTRPWQLWWPDAPAPAVAPCWPLVRSLSVTLDLEGRHTRRITTFLRSEAGNHLTRLWWMRPWLTNGREKMLAGAQLPRLKHLHLKDLMTRIRDFGHLLDAPWLASLESFEIEGIKYERGLQAPPNGKTPWTPESLANDPRLARFNLSLQEKT